VAEPASSRDVWAGRFLSISVEDWPGIGEYEIARVHDAVGVVPITPEGDVLLVRQFRPPIRDDLTEIPAGLLDIEGEDTVACATRELFEETGFRHESIEFMGGIYLAPGFTSEYMHLFWARTLLEAEARPEPGIELVRMPFAEAVTAARRGKMRNASTALALLLAAERVSVA
jgi:8-oxo-dGTP pyrophosphatase MutT (NUDIX family)